ncbi:DUF6518 family protein [Streptomyces sp. NBC_00316]|uniref:DUF6518 family protein n=1 Tax=Streptomyces sp. NBC_00316 TaxID=2975710 RepID=UPI002E2A860F|nr:DUF6518 family protein [Streptomyces sp. NBC_00316]
MIGIRATAGALSGGLLLGILTNLAQGWIWIPDAWGQIANSGAVWSVAAFAAGSLLAKRLPTAAVAGLCAEVGLVVGYYGYAEFGRDGMGDLSFPLVWLALACIAGPLFGIAGSWWRHGCTTGRRAIGLAALAGVFGMEGIHYAWTLHYHPQAWACLTVMVLIPPLMARSHKEKALTLAAAVSFSLLAYTAIMFPLNHISA